MWKNKKEKGIENKQCELLILTELQRGVNVREKACRKLKRMHNINNVNIDVVKKLSKKPFQMQLEAKRLRR